MSDYLFMLESHLTAPQREVTGQVERAAREASLNLFLTGGALRDTLAGFPVRDLDFVVEGDPEKLVQRLARETGARITSADKHLGSFELLFPNGVTAEIAMARRERYVKPGAVPEVEPAPIHDDLVRRDFSVNSIAISLTPASRGLLLDPCNGAGDIERRELRANSNYTFYDDPIRLFRLIRFRIRLGFTVEERTQRQYQSAREAGMERYISPRSLLDELHHIAQEVDAGRILAELEKEGLLALVSPALAGPRLNLPSFEKLSQIRHLIPQGLSFRGDLFPLFMFLLTEKLPPADKQALVKRLRMRKAELDHWQGLPTRAKVLEKALRAPELRRASALFQVLKDAGLDEVLFLYLRSPHRLVRDRIRHFLEKHAYTALSVTDREVMNLAGIQPGHPQFEAIRAEIIAARLDGRKWEPGARPASEAPGAGSGSRGRRASRATPAALAAPPLARRTRTRAAKA